MHRETTPDEGVTTRRDFLALAAAAGLGGLSTSAVFAQASMPTRPIPVSGERLPVIGLGSSKVVQQIETNGTEPVVAVLRALVEAGGKLVDTWPRNEHNDAGFGRAIAEPDLRNALFVTTKIDRVGKEAGIAQFNAALRNYSRDTIDLAQIFSLTDLDVHWPSLEQWKAEGRARYIGVTVAEPRLHSALEEFLGRARPDFMQVNYSITERMAEDRLLPLAADNGVAVLVNRPFMNGAYFDRLEDRPLPDWVAELGATTWAQFSLKYILANPAVTCVLTETSNPHHMHENAASAFGELPDADARARMRALIDEL